MVINIRSTLLYTMATCMRSATYRLYPNKDQEKKMILFLDGTRKVYNHLVEICRLYLGFRMSLPTHYNLVSMASKMRQEEQWLQEIHSYCFASVAKRVYDAFVAWSKRNKDGVGFPRFKSREMFDSFTYNWKTSFDFVGKNGEKDKRERIRLGKIGLVKFSNPFVIRGEKKTATVYRRRVGNHNEWYVSISYEIQDLMKDTLFFEPSMKKIDAGMDLGLENLATFSDGRVIPNDHTYRKKEKELSYVQKKLSKYEKGTAEYNKLVSKLSHKYKKLRNYRKDMFHKASREISAHYANLFMEDLSVKDLAENSPVGMKKSYRDAGWYAFTSMICYKVAETGHSVSFVNPAYTSQLCSFCGEIVSKDLSVRVHHCPYCGLSISRDRNAALNILQRGLGLQTGTVRSKCHDGINS